MAGPGWLRWTFAAVFLAVAGYCVLRTVAAQRMPGAYHGSHRARDIAQLVMSIGMAVMCSPVGGPVPAAGWQTVYLLIAVWFLGASWQALRTPPPVAPIGWHAGVSHHALAALAMLYMLSTTPHGAMAMSTAWMPAHGAGTGLPPVGWAFAAYFAGHAVLLTRGLVRVTIPPGPRIALLGPRIATACQLTMAVGMTYLIAPLG